MGIIWDLYRTISNPFMTSASKHRKIILFCPIFFIAITIINILVTFTNLYPDFGVIGPREQVHYGGCRFNLYIVPFDAILVVIQVMFSFTVSIYAIIALTRKGVN